MSLGTSNRDGGKTSESGHLRAISKLVNGDVIDGLAVSQRAAGANMSVDVAIGDAFVRRSDGTYAHPVFNDAVYNQVIAAADVSNPRRDLIVLYVDYGNAVSTAVSNNTNGVVKIKVVAGTPAGSPSDPSGAAIQASVGSGNPYTVLARVRVGAGVTSLANAVIDDLRTMIYLKTNQVPTDAIQNSAITGAKIAANAIFLGRTTGVATANLNTSYQDILSVTVTVPAGARNVLLMFTTPQAQGSAGTERGEVRLMEGATILQRFYSGFKNPGIGQTYMTVVPVTPSAGSHTYKLNVKMDIGTVGLFYADNTGSQNELVAFAM